MHVKNIFIIADTNVHMLYNRLLVTVTLCKSNMGFFTVLLCLAAFLFLAGAQAYLILLKDGSIATV